MEKNGVVGRVEIDLPKFAKLLVFFKSLQFQLLVDSIFFYLVDLVLSVAFRTFPSIGGLSCKRLDGQIKHLCLFCQSAFWNI